MPSHPAHVVVVRGLLERLAKLDVHSPKDGIEHRTADSLVLTLVRPRGMLARELQGHMAGYMRDIHHEYKNAGTPLDNVGFVPLKPDAENPYHLRFLFNTHR